MSILLQDRKDEDLTLFAYRNRDIYEKITEFRSEQSLDYPKIKTFFGQALFYKKFEQFATCVAVPTGDAISRLATWNALYGENSLPEIEENAVEKYAGSLDQYLPDCVPIEKVINHAKG